MNKDLKTEQKRFYLASVDILQGLAIFLMVIAHTAIWWDNLIDEKWPNVPFFVAITGAAALLVPPTFFFIYSFNVQNSLLRKGNESERRKNRHRLLKRTIIFLLVAELSEAITALITSPKFLLNFLLTWELFHMFALSTVFLLLIFEIAWQIELKGYWNQRQVTMAVLSISFILVITIFLLYHDYSLSQEIEKVYVNLDAISILQRIIFEDGQNPVIPWLSFTIIGGLTASYLDLPHEQKNAVLKKSGLVIVGGTIILISGILFLGKERYIGPPFHFPASSSYLFIVMGFLVLTTTTMILLIDINSLYTRQSVNKLFLPLVIISKISLTVYIIHNVAFIIPSNSPLIQLLIPSVTAAIVVGVLYSSFFVMIAFVWQKWRFKYSLEWMIFNFQKAQWRWWVRKPTEITV